LAHIFSYSKFRYRSSLLKQQYSFTANTTYTAITNMSKPFDYSKWDKIELSDDEEDVHPNIDKESWFRMKHRSRVEREEHEEKDKQRINAEVRKVLQMFGKVWTNR
jgi:Cdc37 N terminal kinase binding